VTRRSTPRHGPIPACHPLEAGRGARYTRAHPPLRVLAASCYASKGQALRAEYRLKPLSRGEKLAFFAADG